MRSTGNSPNTPLAGACLRDAEVWIFDLDNTLYPAASRLFDQVDRNITRFICERLDLDWDDAHKIQKSYFREHGTTMRGMMSNHGTDPDDFLAFVHDIDLAAVPRDDRLDAALSRLPGRKIVFTNGSVDHAQRVMEKVGVAEHFETIFDIVASEFTPKPEPSVYQQLIDSHAIRPETAVMVEDMARNLEPAAALGMTCVWVHTENAWGQEGSENDYVHHVTDDLTGWLTDLTALKN